MRLASGALVLAVVMGVGSACSSSGATQTVASSSPTTTKVGICANEEFTTRSTDLRNYVAGFNPLDPDAYTPLWSILEDLADIADAENETTTARTIRKVADDVLEASYLLGSAMDDISVSALNEAEEAAGVAADGIRDVVAICP